MTHNIWESTQHYSRRCTYPLFALLQPPLRLRRGHSRQYVNLSLGFRRPQIHEDPKDEVTVAVAISLPATRQAAPER